MTVTVSSGQVHGSGQVCSDACVYKDDSDEVDDDDDGSNDSKDDDGSNDSEDDDYI